MQASAIPTKFPIPWAANATSSHIRPIPVASQIGVQAGAASLTDGFPPDTFVPEAAGGVPPFGQDTNGILNQITAWLQWVNAGGPVTYDASFATAIGGYPKGACLTAAAGGAWWISTVDNNASNPDAGGAGWLAVAPGQVYAGNPNGHVAGTAGTAGGSFPSMLWDVTNSLLWICTTSGTASTAIWSNTGSSGGGAYWCGTSTGSANAQSISLPASIQNFGTGNSLWFTVGAGLTNTGALTITIPAQGSFAGGTFPVRKDSPTGPVALTGGEVVAGNTPTFKWDGTYLRLVATAMGSAAQKNAGNTVADPGTGSLEVASPVAAQTGASYTYTAANRGCTINRSNAGTAMTDTLPSGVANGWWVEVFNSDTTANLVVSAPTGASMNGTVNGAITIAPKQSAAFTVDASGNYWNTVAPVPTIPPTSGTYVNGAAILPPGTYIIDTSAGGFTLTLAPGQSAGAGWQFIDGTGTWSPNNLTINLGSYTLTPPYATAPQSGPLVCNVAGEQFLLWYNGSTLKVF